MNYKKILIISIIIIVIGAFLLIIRDSDDKINSFDQCVEAGFPIMESYPQQCRTDDNQNFVQDIGNEIEKMDLIRIDFPRPNQVIESPLIITGQARGNWFFEGDFPIELLDDNENIIIQSYATAKSEWMTEDFVQFEVEISFDAPATVKGVLVLKKDNASGLSEQADELRVPIIFY